MSPKKVVLLHDWLLGYRGGERVLEALCNLFPGAKIYTLFYKKGSVSAVIESHKIRASFLNLLPGSDRIYRLLLPLLPVAVETMKIDGNPDLVLSSSHCLIKGLRPWRRPKLHICYIHSPMRYMYDQFDVYFPKSAKGWSLRRLMAQALRPFLTAYDRWQNKHVDVFLSNSRFVANRVKNFYQVDSQVLYPFVDLVDFRHLPTPSKKNYFVVLSAFAPNKRIDLAIEAFNTLGLPLKIVGSGQQEKQLREMARGNIQFLGSLPREQVVQLLAEAQALVFPGVEDFGITPLEALAAGTPVIALRKGGVIETMTEETAEFFEEENAAQLVEAVGRFQKRSFELNILKARAEAFSKEIFLQNLEKIIETEWQRTQVVSGGPTQ